MPSRTRSAASRLRCRRPRTRCGRRSSAAARPAKRPNREVSMYGFTFQRPSTVRQAASLLAKSEDAKLLAGGQTLIPTMKQRLASPASLIDLSLIEGLSGIELRGRSIIIGAMTRHAQVADSPVVQENLPALAELAGEIGDPHVRNMGTLGGSLANNDPNADYPAGALGLAATIVTNKRRISSDEFFKGLFETALESDEIITKVQFPKVNKAGYVKFANPASRYALVGVFVSKRGSEIRVAVTGAGSNGVFRVPSFEEALGKRFGAKSLEGMTIPADGMASDIHGSAEYRAHLVGVLARRAVAAAGGPSGRGQEAADKPHPYPLAPAPLKAAHASALCRQNPG